MPLVMLVREAALLGRDVLELLVALVREIRGAANQREAVQDARRAVAQRVHTETQRAAAAALKAQK